jgi:hypothetical protein
MVIPFWLNYGPPVGYSRKRGNRGHGWKVQRNLHSLGYILHQWTKGLWHQFQIELRHIGQRLRQGFRFRPSIRRRHRQ